MLSPLAEEGLSIYETRLRKELERSHLGQAVAIHIDSGDYDVGSSHSAAARLLMTRHKRDGRIVTFTIGPPSDSDKRLSERILGTR